MLTDARVAVIIPAAGVGRRFAPAAAGAAPSASKLELDLAGKPVFLRSVELFLSRRDVAAVLLAVHPETLDEFRFRWGDKLAFHGVRLVPGGLRERWETVKLALAQVPTGCTHIAVHDAARPLATAGLIDRVFEAGLRHGAAFPGEPVSPTLRRVAELPVVDEPDPLAGILGDVGAPKPAARWRALETVDRAHLVAVQTPQVFEAGLLRRAYAQIDEGRIDPAGVTDDAGLVAALGVEVVVVEGEASNLKITRPQDVELARALIERREAPQRQELAKKRLFLDDEG